MFHLQDLDVCEICSNPRRDQSVICVVEDLRDVMAIEKTSSFNGLYHVLGGKISPVDGIGPRGSSIEFFSLDKVLAYFLPSFISIFINVVFILSNTASRMEHKKDRLIVRKI